MKDDLVERLLDWCDNAPLSKPPYELIREAASDLLRMREALEDAKYALESVKSDEYDAFYVRTNQALNKITSALTPQERGEC